MKKLVSLLLILAVVSLVSCNMNNPPAKVKAAFEKQFPDIKKANWEQEEDGIWEAEFKMDDKKIEAAFDANGTWLETEYEIYLKELPDTVLSVLKAEFEGFELKGAEHIVSPDFEGYEIKIEKEDENGEVEYEVFITKEGEIIKKELKEDDDDDDHGHDNDYDDGHDDD